MFNNRHWTRTQTFITDISAIYVIFRYEFPCKAWIPITSNISKKNAKVLSVKNVQEGRMSVARSKCLVICKEYRKGGRCRLSTL